jgi:hypothetical protein
VAEWLRNGLQNRVHQFNSGRGLHTQPIDFTKIFSSQAIPSAIHDRCPEWLPASWHILKNRSGEAVARVAMLTMGEGERAAQ